MPGRLLLLFAHFLFFPLIPHVLVNNHKADGGTAQEGQVIWPQIPRQHQDQQGIAPPSAVLLSRSGARVSSSFGIRALQWLDQVGSVPSAGKPSPVTSIHDLTVACMLSLQQALHPKELHCM